ANHDPASACAVGIVRVQSNEIVCRRLFLIRPPTKHFVFSYLHGITWEDVKSAPTFGELWPELTSYFDGVEFLVAHNARFDRGVLATCCLHAGLRPPVKRFLCTMLIARRLWRIHPTKLPDVCRRLGIPLNHHDAVSDSEACARIMIHAIPHLSPPNTLH
ncbi:MAG: 3'-5' exonuclease, partial [Verrucomicrobiae bacterium]|nr:3'-5' exonuclease [Verrucomicrobiae bacterium]